MTPAEFKTIRKGLWLTQIELGQLLGVSGLAVSYYETGRRGISPTIANLLRRIKQSGG